MKRPSAKILFLPVLGLLAAASVLLVLFSITTFLNLERAAKQAERGLAAQGGAVVSGLTAGLRTGWRFWSWRQESLEGLIYEMSQATDVAFIVLLNDHGRILVHSNPKFIGRKLQDFQKIVSPLRPDAIVGWFEDENIYLAGRRVSRADLGSQGMPRNRGMRGSRLERMFAPAVPQYILVGLKTDAYLESRREQLLHALYMAGLLFIVGSGAIYLIFVIQNYRTIDRTLSDLNTYTTGIVNNMPNGLISLDSNRNVVMVNQVAREIFGWPDIDERKLNQTPEIKMLTDEFVPRLEASAEPILDFEYAIDKSDGSRIPLAVSVDYTPGGMSDETDSGVVFILRDLSQIKSLEEQVLQGEKLAAVGRLAAGVAHEVRNPLSSMRGLAKFLAKSHDENSREAEYLKVMVNEIDRLNRVVTGLLNFARPRVPELAEADLNEIVGHTLDLVASDARHKGVEIQADISDGPVMVSADKDQAIQAILNILLNALEAMDDGGKLTLTTKADDLFSIVSIGDTGAGILAEDRSKLFDPFYSTKKNGTGLGLAQVAQIMKAHNGKVILKGSSSAGSLFMLHFPSIENKGQTDHG